ncbi:VPLPA-CTERM sorting domain-containing protein [Oceanicoccus sagamiensis]|uniref:PEP-CTERM protein-sorting domain-containing protein n=1 Tax=Oceanicoccus sagamiensis TaxID=716816 RepID=A0A1X9NBD9_9GAMM|nr:VPLPA-CTERM sorting domain-containing protein [Oceanicoccus sagamiensis]ARN72869.1 hypothetical protein BST96_01360 [Oceanicoccus sagamiensis]
MKTLIQPIKHAIKRPLTAMVFSAVAIALTSSANAAMVHYEFSGFITSIDDPAGSFGVLSVNDGFTVTYAIDLDEPETNSFIDNDDLGRYVNIDLVNLDVGIYSLTGGNPPGAMFVGNNSLLTQGANAGKRQDTFRIDKWSSGYDAYYSINTLAFLGDLETVGNPTSINSDDIPTSVPSPGSFEINSFKLVGWQPRDETASMLIEGQFRSLTVSVVPSAVPVPAAAWLFGSALIGLAGIKRKK